MIVMKEHDWFDDDIKDIRREDGDDFAIIIKHDYGFDNGLATSIHKKDVIALAKEFNLIVFEKDSQL